MLTMRAALPTLMFVAVVLAGCGGSKSSHNNIPPSISPIDTLNIPADTDTQVITLTISDDRTALEQLVIIASSSNNTLVTGEGIVLGSNATSRTLLISPEADTIGTTIVTLTLSDTDNNTVQTQFQVNVIARQTPAEGFVRDIFANDENSKPLAINGIELQQDVDDITTFDDLI